MARNIFVFTLVLLGLQGIAFGQNVTLSIGSTTGTAGSTVVLPINLTSAGAAKTSGLQWTFSYSSDITSVTVVASASTLAAGKSLSCSGNNCLIVGFNSTVIPDGAVATATFQISGQPSNNPLAIQLSGVVASTAGGTSIPASGTSGSITLPVSVTLNALSCSPLTINTPGTSSCTVSLSGTAPAGGFPVSLSSNNANLTVPSGVTVASGQTSKSFTATGAQVSANQNGIITAGSGGGNLISTISLVAPAQLSSLACAPSTLGSNASSTCTVTLNKAASSAATVALTSNNALLAVPASVTVASGQGNATFTATSGIVSSNQAVTVTASLNGQSQPSTINLAAAAQLSSVSCSPGTVNAPAASTCTVTLTAAAASAANVTLSSDNANVSVPGSISVGAGLSSATFTATVAAVTADQNALLTATLNGSSKTFTLAASSPAQLTSLACAPSTLGSNASGICTVSLSKVASSAATVALTSNNALLTIPASVIVTAGQSSATFTAASGAVGANQNAIVTAIMNAQSQQVTISLAAATQLSSLICAPGTVSSPGTALCSVTLTAPTANAVNVTLQSTNTSVTVPNSINIGAGTSSASFNASAAAVVSNQTAILTATMNSVSRTFSLTATGNTPAQLSTVACSPSTLGSNAAANCTVTMSAATTSTVIVSLVSDNALLSLPTSVAIASGQSNASFTATSGSVTSSQNATVTATLSGVSQQSVIALTATSQLSSLSCAAASVSGPGTTACTVTLSSAPSNAMSVALSSNNSSVTVPASVNVGAGQASAAFNATVTAVTSNQVAMLTASLSGISKTFAVTATASASVQLTSVSCTPAALTSNLSTSCSVTLNAPATSSAAVSLRSTNGLLSVPPSVTIAAGQSNATFTANSGSISSGQTVTLTATLNGQSQTASINLAASVNCQEFQTSPGGLCMVQDIFPWVTFGGGWESRLSAANLTKGNGGGTIQFSFTLLPAVPATGGIQNHMPAFFTVNKSKQMLVAETATYTLNSGKSIVLDFVSSPTGCDSHGQNCSNLQDPTTTNYGAVMVQYVADNPAYLRGIAKAQLTLLANSSTGAYGWQTTEHEMFAANQWTAPVSVSANQTANPQTSQQASAALANPGTAPITVRGTLYAGNGQTVTFRDFQVPALGAVPMVFSQDASLPFGGFGNAMFPGGQNFNGLVTFQVIAPNNGVVSAMVLQYVGNAMSSVEVNPQGTAPVGHESITSVTRCAEFPMATDGSCTAQFTLPWVVFGAGWESRLKAANPPSATAGPVQFRFTLLPAAPVTSGAQNHLPVYFTDSRSSQLQVGDSAAYSLNAGQSVDVNFLNPPSACDLHGQNCASQPDPAAFGFGSVLVQYSSTDPAALRRLSSPQLAFLTRSGDNSYSSQITEQGAAAATTWTAPVTISANQGADPANNLAASAAIANPGATPLIVRGTLLDESGNVVTYTDFQIPAFGAIGSVFAWDPGQPSGGFGSAAFPQGQDFSGWVTFEVTTPNSGGVNVVVLQYVGDTMSSVNVQSLP